MLFLHRYKIWYQAYFIFLWLHQTTNLFDIHANNMYLADLLFSRGWTLQFIVFQLQSTLCSHIVLSNSIYFSFHLKQVDVLSPRLQFNLPNKGQVTRVKLVKGCMLCCLCGLYNSIVANIARVFECWVLLDFLATAERWFNLWQKWSLYTSKLTMCVIQPSSSIPCKFENNLMWFCLLSCILIYEFKNALKMYNNDCSSPFLFSIYNYIYGTIQ